MRELGESPKEVYFFFAAFFFAFLATSFTSGF
jgi:hypothetical protein